MILFNGNSDSNDTINDITTTTTTTTTTSTTTTTTTTTTTNHNNNSNTNSNSNANNKPRPLLPRPLVPIIRLNNKALSSYFKEVSGSLSQPCP